MIFFDFRIGFYSVEQSPKENNKEKKILFVCKILNVQNVKNYIPVIRENLCFCGGRKDDLLILNKVKKNPTLDWKLSK